MRTLNLASPSLEPEDGESDTTFEGPDAAPPPGPPKTRRLFYILALFVVVLGGGYIAVTQFTQLLAPAPEPPARPIRPIAKSPARPAGSPGLPTPGPAKAEAPAGAPTKVVPAAKAPMPMAPVQSPLGQAAKKAEPLTVAKAAPAQRKPAPSPPSPAAQAEAPAASGTFSLQVGAMISEANAQKLKERLEALGYNSLIRRGKAYLRRHLVTTGDYADQSGAAEAAKRLSAQGISARVTPAAGGRFSVEAGSFANEDDAIDLARQLQRLNFPPRIQDLAQNATVYQVRVGSFASREEAHAKGAELKGKGFPYLVVKN